MVREVWVAWAHEQPNPKATWLAGWEMLPERDREVDCRIGEALYAAGLERGRALGAREGRIECHAAVRAEQLDDNLNNDDDRAYAAAVDDCSKAIARRSGGQGK
jgi:hypothetical protein